MNIKVAAFTVSEKSINIHDQSGIAISHICFGMEEMICLYVLCTVPSSDFWYLSDMRNVTI